MSPLQRLWLSPYIYTHLLGWVPGRGIFASSIYLKTSHLSVAEITLQTNSPNLIIYHLSLTVEISKGSSLSGSQCWKLLWSFSSNLTLIFSYETR